MNIRDIDLNLLVVFDAIFTSHSITRAAAQLDMSQPAISNALRRMREQLDDPLFVRKGNGVEPTLRAVELAGPIEEMIVTLKSALVPDETFDPQTSNRTFRVLLADPLEPVVLPSVLGAIENQGGVSIDLVPPQVGQVEDLVDDGAVDLAIFLRPPQRKSLTIEPLVSFETVLAARSDHPGFGKLPFPELIKTYGFAALNLERGGLKNSEKVKIQARPAKRDVIRVHRVSSIPQILEQTDLLGFLPKIYAQHIASRFDLQFIDAPLPMGEQTIFLIWHSRNSNDQGLLWLRNAIKSSLPIESQAI